MKVYKPIFTRGVILIDVMGNIVLPLFLMLPLAMWAWIAIGNESSLIWRFVTIVPIFPFVVYGVLYLFHLQWNLWIRMERCTTYIQTKNTLAVKIPRQDIKFIKKCECLAFAPSGNSLILGDGSRYRLPGMPAGEMSDISPGEEIIKSWWPEIDIERVRSMHKKKLPNREVVILAVVVVVLLQSTLYAVVNHGGFLEAGRLGSIFVGGLLIPVVYLLSRMLLYRYHAFRYSLQCDKVASEVIVTGVS